MNLPLLTEEQEDAKVLARTVEIVHRYHPKSIRGWWVRRYLRALALRVLGKST